MITLRCLLLTLFCMAQLLFFTHYLWSVFDTILTNLFFFGFGITLQIIVTPKFIYWRLTFSYLLTRLWFSTNTAHEIFDLVFIYYNLHA